LISSWLISQAANHREVVRDQEPGQMQADGPTLDEVLLSARTGEPVSLQEAARRVAFRLPGSPKLPDGYQFQGCCVCRDDCCDMVQCQIHCGVDRVYLVLASGDRPVRYGDRPVLETQVAGRPARIVQCDCGLACSWECQGTALTLIGPHDLSKVVQLVSYVSERLEKWPN
jgi:hypothetical protein